MGAQGVLSTSFQFHLRDYNSDSNNCVVGRPFMYGLAIAGREGVEQILLQTICDLHISMGLAGYDDINEIIGKRDEIMMKLEYKL